MLGQQSRPWWLTNIEPNRVSVVFSDVTSTCSTIRESRAYVGLMLGQRLRQWANIKPTCCIFRDVGHYAVTWLTPPPPPLSRPVITSHQAALDSRDKERKKAELSLSVRQESPEEWRWMSHKSFTRCWYSVGTALGQHCNNIGLAYRVCGDDYKPSYVHR